MNVTKYITILKIELNSLKDDISVLIDYEKELHDKNKHTNFVYLENLVVLKDEIMGINGIIGKIDNISKTLDPNDYVEELTSIIKNFINERGYPLAVFELFVRKTKKIKEINEILWYNNCYIPETSTTYI